MPGRPGEPINKYNNKNKIRKAADVKAEINSTESEVWIQTSTYHQIQVLPALQENLSGLEIPIFLGNQDHLVHQEVLDHLVMKVKGQKSI